MKITQEVRDYAAAQKGMAEKAVEFVQKGAKIYS